jgi:uncharacterized protein
MGTRLWFTAKQRAKLMPAWEKEFKSPVPTQMISNGEFMPMPQTERQARVEALIQEAADLHGKKMGLDRREFLKTASGMAAAFVAMNQVYGNLFSVNVAEASDAQAAEAHAAAMKGQAVIDTQTHMVHAEYGWDPLNFLRDLARGNNSKKVPWNPALAGEKASLTNYMFENYVKEVFLDSDTAISLISGFTSDTASNMPLTDGQMVEARNIVNGLAGTRRMLAHGYFWPGSPGWLENMDKAIDFKVDAWKGYTVGDPLGPSKYPWLMNDEKLTYPGYEKAMKSGIRNICIHKGLIPNDYETSFKNWRFSQVTDIVKAAKDFPQLNFIIYHAGMRSSWEYDGMEKEMNDTGRVSWVTDLAEEIQKSGVKNVYPEIGSTFGSTVTSYPRVTAFILGTLIKAAGVDHVIWGTDSVWYGSPQWQIEAFRRLEIPDDLQSKYGFKPLGPATGKVKTTILAANQAKLYKLPLTADGRMPAEYATDGLAKLKAEYQAAGPDRDNLAFGYIRKAGVV